MFENATRDSSFWLTRNRVVFPEFAAYVGLGLDQMFRSRSNNRRWVEASAENTLIASELSYMFPKAKFLNILRDGRDVVSLLVASSPSGATRGAFSEACEAWRVYAARSIELQETFPARVLEVRHEHLSSRPVSEAKKMMSFLSDRRESAVGEYLRAEAPSIRERLWGRWEEDWRLTFTVEAGDMMRELGYPLKWSE